MYLRRSAFIPQTDAHSKWQDQKDRKMDKSDTRDGLIKKGLACLPEVTRTEVRPVNGEAWKGKALTEGGSIRIDFGRHMAGRLALTFGFEGEHPDAPVRLSVRFAEVPWEFDENADEYHGWICSGWVQSEQLYLDVLPCSLQLPRRYAFRYVEIRVLAVSSKFRLVVKDAKAYAETSADEKKLRPLRLAEDKGDLAQLDRIALNTMRDCMQHVFEDGPKRDRRLWMGDLRIQALVNYETYHSDDMVKGCLYLFGGLTLKNGQVAAAIFMDPAPEADDSAMFDYSLLFVPALWDYYEHTRDIKAIRDLWPTALTQIGLAEERLDDDGLVCDSDKLGWCFLDWNLELNKQAGAQGVFLYAVLAGIRLAETLGEKGAAEGLARLYEKMKTAALTNLYDSEKKLFVSGSKRQVSYASQIWMVLGRAVAGEKAREVLKNAEEDPDALRIVTPYLYHHYIQALLDAGEREEALQKMAKYWGGMARQGADTFWEMYDPENPKASPYGGTIVNSYCHAWSCGPSYFLRKYFDANLNQIRGVVFDLDGVLVSTDESHFRAWKAVADELHIPFDRKDNERLRGVSRMDSLEIILEKYTGEPLSIEDKEALAAKKNDIYRGFLADMTPDDVDPAVRNTLAGLKRRGYRLAIGSSSKNTKYILEKTDLTQYFDGISDGTNITKSKPDPEVFLKAAWYIGLAPENCVAVDDADAGIEAAKAANMTAAGIHGSASCGKTDLRLESFDELLSYLSDRASSGSKVLEDSPKNAYAGSKRTAGSAG